jgi:macrolide-specific efflux system membrane fusion protein
MHDVLGRGIDAMTNKIWLGAVAIAIVAAAGYWALGRAALSGADTPTPSASARTEAVLRRDLGSTVIATGVIRPQVGAEVQVGSRVSGILKELHVTIGDQVPAGHLLAVLDPTEFEARRNQAAAQLETATADRSFALLELERARQMLPENVITQAEFDAVERSFNIAEAQASVAEAALESAEIQLGYTRITAPIGGVVASVSTQVGETVAASFASPTFVTIIDLDRLEVWAYVDETDIGRVEVGQTATFTVDTYMGTDFTGTVTAIQPAAEIVDNVVNYVTLIDIGPTDGKTLRPEMTATVNISLEGRDDVLSIPNGAVRRDAEGAYAYVPGVEGPVRRAIRTGYRGSSYTEVLEGLEEGEEVIVGTVQTVN